MLLLFGDSEYPLLRNISGWFAVIKRIEHEDMQIIQCGSAKNHSTRNLLQDVELCKLLPYRTVAMTATLVVDLQSPEGDAFGAVQVGDEEFWVAMLLVVHLEIADPTLGNQVVG